MTEVNRCIGISVEQFTNRLERALAELISADMADSPRSRRFRETVERARAIAALQSKGERMIRVYVGSAVCPWEERKRSADMLFAADLLDIAEDLLNTADHFGEEFRKDARELLVFLETVVAARLGVDFLNVVMLALTPPATPVKKTGGAKVKRKPPTKQQMLERRKLSDIAERGMQLLKKCEKLCYPQGVPLRNSDSTVIFIDRKDTDSILTAKLHSRYGRVGSILLEAKRNNNHEATRLLRSIMSFLREADPHVKNRQAAGTLMESQKVQELLNRANGTASTH